MIFTNRTLFHSLRKQRLLLVVSSGSSDFTNSSHSVGPPVLICYGNRLAKRESMRPVSNHDSLAESGAIIHHVTVLLLSTLVWTTELKAPLSSDPLFPLSNECCVSRHTCSERTGYFGIGAKQWPQ